MLEFLQSFPVHWLMTAGVLLLLEACAILTAFVVLLERRSARSAWAWLLMILLLPIGGAIFYWLFGNSRVGRPRLRRRRRKARELRARLRARSRGKVFNPESLIEGDTPVVHPFTHAETQLMRFAAEVADRSPRSGNSVELLLSGDTILPRLLESIANARAFIHFEYYIFKPDREGLLLLNALAEAAARGVACRLLLDAVGSWDMRGSHLRHYHENGGRVAWFFPVNPFGRPFSFNLRNHRKIAVIDGQEAYTGGLNIGEEYMTGRWKGKAWNDAHLRLAGPSVEDLNEVFAEDWITAGGGDLDDPESTFFPVAEPAGGEVVQIVESGPDRQQRTFSDVIFTAITLATRSIRITTPYFAPDEPLLQALRSAALRGVRVEFLLPGFRTNHPLIYWCGRWHCQVLIEAGVHVYEHTEGFLHAKVVTVDDAWSMVGSANLDERSFRLNFEVNALVFSRKLAQELNGIFRDMFDRSRRVSLGDYYRQPIYSRLADAISRLLGPVL